MKFKKKSSPLKLLCQSQPDFADMILQGSYQQSLVENGTVVSEEKIFF
jgi:hypothetical protein